MTDYRNARTHPFDGADIGGITQACATGDCPHQRAWREWVAENEAIHAMLLATEDLPTISDAADAVAGFELPPAPAWADMTVQVDAHTRVPMLDYLDVHHPEYAAALRAHGRLQ